MFTARAMARLFTCADVLVSSGDDSAYEGEGTRGDERGQ